MAPHVQAELRMESPKPASLREEIPAGAKLTQPQEAISQEDSRQDLFRIRELAQELEAQEGPWFEATSNPVLEGIQEAIQSTQGMRLKKANKILHEAFGKAALKALEHDQYQTYATCKAVAWAMSLCRINRARFVFVNFTDLVAAYQVAARVMLENQEVFQAGGDAAFGLSMKIFAEITEGSKQDVAKNTMYYAGKFYQEYPRGVPNSFQMGLLKYMGRDLSYYFPKVEAIQNRTFAKALAQGIEGAPDFFRALKTTSHAIPNHYRATRTVFEALAYLDWKQEEQNAPYNLTFMSVFHHNFQISKGIPYGLGGLHYSGKEEDRAVTDFVLDRLAEGVEDAPSFLETLVAKLPGNSGRYAFSPRTLAGMFKQLVTAEAFEPTEEKEVRKALTKAYDLNLKSESYPVFEDLVAWLISRDCS